MHLNGTVDEAQAVMGMARAEAEPGSELDTALVGLERDLYVLMAEVATDPSKRHKLVAGTTLVSTAMVDAVEARIDDLLGRFAMPSEFVIPGATRASAALDLARTVVRRAERLGVSLDLADSLAPIYLNRLSDLLWAMARWTEGGDHLSARSAVHQSRRNGSADGHEG